MQHQYVTLDCPTEITPAGAPSSPSVILFEDFRKYMTSLPAIVPSEPLAAGDPAAVQAPAPSLFI
jgi:hypothetical protein